MIYEPKEDSYLLEQYVKKYSRNKNVLDIGSGSGIQALAALKAKAKLVTATDVDKESLAHLFSLANSYSNIKIIKSNLFSSLPKKKKFDLIIFNPPYLPQDSREDKESQRATTGGKFGDEVIAKFLKQSKDYLSPRGFILIIVSSLTPIKKIDKILSATYIKTVLEKKSFFMESLEVWKIEHSVNKNL